ncbi:Tkl protein kinase [Globisporangium polare]
MYNSTTLPPGLDSSVLDGGELVNVETKATTRSGETSVSYTIVVKKGDVVEKVQQSGYNTTNPAAVVLPSSSDITSSTTDINNASSNSNSTAVTVSTVASSGGLSSEVIVGLVLGALVLGLLIAGFVMRRRSGKKNAAPSSTKSSARTIEEGYSTLESIRMEPRDAAMNSTRHMSYESDMRPSPRRRSSGSIWEDAVIVAARIPFDKVHVGKLLSRGGFGEVYRGTYRDQIVAIKKLLPETRKDLQHIESFLGEIKLQASLDHPHIVTFLGVAWESLSDLYALSEFMERGDLRSLLVKYNEPGSGTPQGFSYEKVKIALQIAHALTYLHSLQPQLLHRDLKSRNILLTSKLDAKLTDFGSSRVCATPQDATMTAGVGSSLWMAPEVMVGKRYDEKSDVFSLGIVLSELDTHELPYSHRKEASSGGGQIASTSKSLGSNTGAGGGGRSLPETAILQMVSMGKLQVQFSRNCPPEMVALAHKCINVDPHERPTAAEVLYQLHVVLRLFETM